MSAFYKGDTQSWWPGCVVRVHGGDDNDVERTSSSTSSSSTSSNITYAVKFDDGDYDAAVIPTHIKPLNDQQKPVMVTALHRRFESSNRYFSNSLRPVLFGYPVVLQCVPANTNGYDLYRQVWEQTRHIVPGNVQGDPPEKYDEETKEEEGSEGSGRGGGAGGAGGAGAGGAFLGNARFIHSGDGYPCLDWGFQLRRVSNIGFSCSWTEWTRGTLGTELKDGPERVHFPPGFSTIAIDWAPSLANRLYTVAKIMKVHPSVERCRQIDTKSLSLYECMDTFIRAEKLDGNDQVYCSKCKNHEDASKKVTLYRNPPVLIMHLKRFKYTQYTRGKIARMVTFPLENADLRFATPKKPKESVPLDLQYWTFLGGKLAGGVDGTGVRDGGGGGNGEDETVVHSEETSEASDELPVPLYDCIGVVNHYGDLGSGHYTAFAKNPYDGKWRQFDDNRVTIIEPRHVMTEHAYLLFYLRQDMRGESYAPGFEYRMPTPEQVKEQLAMRKRAKRSGRCVVQ